MSVSVPDAAPETPRVVTAAGHPAGTWTSALESLPAYEPTELLEIGSGDRLVVAVPHPDDETLALAGVLQRLHAGSVHLVLVLATAGEAPYSGPAEPSAELGRIRIGEFEAAISALGLASAEVHLLDLPDGRLAEYEGALLDALTDLLHPDPARRRSRTAVLAPWIKDPHRDHQAVGRAAGTAARRTGSARWSYPVWMRHGFGPADPAVPWSGIRRIALSPAELECKRAAIAHYASQLNGPTPQIGPVLPASVVEHFTDGHELLIRPAPGEDELRDHFDALYEGIDDPWQAGTSWYERRKRSILMDSLPRPRYACGWEPGCSLGHLSAELARRCDRLVASDISPRAVAAARDLGVGQHVSFAVAQTPAEPPDLEPGSCDLVVLSEFLYYLPEPVRAATLRLAETLLVPGGHLVVAHWRGHPGDAHCSGEQANAEAVAAVGAHPVHHLDEHFVLDVAEKAGHQP